MAKRNPQDILDDIEGSDLDDAMERIAALTPEQRRAELLAAGFTTEELNAKADAFAEKLSGGTAPAAKAEGGTAKDGEVIALSERGGQRPVRRRPLAAIVAAGVAAAAAGGVIYTYVGNNTQVAAPRPDAMTLRREALDACRGGSWQRCLDKLDEARELDPDGDTAPEVEAARRSANEALHPSK